MKSYPLSFLPDTFLHEEAGFLGADHFLTGIPSSVLRYLLNFTLVRGSSVRETRSFSLIDSAKGRLQDTVVLGLSCLLLCVAMAGMLSVLPSLVEIITSRFVS